jgi:eukaryotic-like serine/threonine-protein kinase
MKDRCFVQPAPSSTSPESSGPARLQARAIPYDILKEASSRLATISLIYAMLWGLGDILYRVSMASMGVRHGPNPSDAICAASSLLSLALYFYVRRRADRDPQTILNLGLVFMVLTSVSLGVVLHWDAVPHDAVILPQISWIGASVLIFAALVPNSPARMLFAGAIAVTMNPIGMLVAEARGTWHFGPASNMLVMHYPDYLLVGVAAVISRVVTRLGQQVSKAREMGSYRLIERLGQGGMGEVWRARHKMLARDAAIKLIQPGMMGPGTSSQAHLLRQRFEQEAKATAVLRSPHTVELYDFGIASDGVFYYVMELLDGIDLDRLVKRFGPQPPARVIYILTQVCRSLEEAHRGGMVHRDIKPGNIFLCRMGNEFDFAKVLDFGLVKVSGGSETMTAAGTGGPTGTPAYLAPELARGSSHVDGRTDLYGLGCVAYWLLTGRLVFEETGAMAMILAHIGKAPPSVSERSAVDIPEALDRAIQMCLAKEPADRPANGDELAKMLGSVRGVDAWTRDDAERWWQTNIPAASPDAAGQEETLAG